jgi:hypothetical protein
MTPIRPASRLAEVHMPGKRRGNLHLLPLPNSLFLNFFTFICVWECERKAKEGVSHRNLTKIYPAECNKPLDSGLRQTVHFATLVGGVG